MAILHVRQKNSSVREVQMRVIERHKEVLMKVRDRIEANPDIVFDLLNLIENNPPRVIVNQKRGTVTVDEGIELIVR